MRRLAIVWRLPIFTGWFLLEVLRSSGQILLDIATPGSRATPRVVAMPLRSLSDGEVTLIASLITLTPGTLTLGTRHEGARRVLLVHSMYHHDAESALADLQDMEDRMLHAFTREDRP